MSRQTIIQNTLNIINKLPDDKAEEISEFADFIMKRYEEQHLTKGIHLLNADSKSFDFLINDDDIYSDVDLKEIYNA